MNTNTKLYVGLALMAVCALLMSVSSSMEKKDAIRRQTILYNTIKIAQEWAYFEGQKEAMNGDVRIKYDEQLKTYSWTKSCWDDGMKPTFDPSHSENISYFLTKPNLTK
jgi:hypothetical protein